MGTYKVFDGTNWVDICDCALNVFHPVQGWTDINPSNCVVKYFDGTTWCPINCGGLCTCPDGYVFNPGSGLCEQVTLLPPSVTLGVGSTLYYIGNGETESGYGSNGARLYEDISLKQFPINGYTDNSAPPSGPYRVRENAGTGTDLTYNTSIPTNLIFKATNNVSGRLNKCGLWAGLCSTGPIFFGDVCPNPNPPFETCCKWPTNQWLKTEFCVTVPETKQYIFAMAGDNQIRASIRSTIYNPQSQAGPGPWTTNLVNLWGGTTPSQPPSGISGQVWPFRFWFMFPITLPAGTHTFILEGMNFGQSATFGAEIYNLDYAQMLTFINTPYPDPSILVPTAPNALTPYILFSTQQLILDPKLPIVYGGTATYSCSGVGGELNTCYGVPACVTLQTTPCN